MHWFMYWLLSMIVKNLGTLYLIFSAIAGMMSIASIVLDIYNCIFYDIISTSVHISSNVLSNEVGVQTEDLVNTVNSLDSIHNTSNNVEYNEVGVQTEDLVNTVQNLDSEIPQQEPIHVDEGVQTPIRSLYAVFKEWLMFKKGVNTSDIYTPGNVRIEEWRENLDPSQD